MLDGFLFSPAVNRYKPANISRATVNFIAATTAASSGSSYPLDIKLSITLSSEQQQIFKSRLWPW